MGTTTAVYASRMMKGSEVKALATQAKRLLEQGDEIEANILLLRHAAKKSEKLKRSEVRQWPLLKKLG